MFVVTADQVSSRTTADRVGATVRRMGAVFEDRLVLPADRTAGDELQLLFATGPDALEACLALDREHGWSIGVGVGSVNHPLPAGVRESAGGAFIAARTAVDRAKRRSTRFAIEHEKAHDDAADVQALVDLLLILRARRSAQGWELFDVLEAEGTTQADAAARLGISPQAVSKRAQAAQLRAERAAIAPLFRLFDNLDGV
ncbi:MAG: DNA-binding protein [Terrimesophilobacter sp.]